MHVGGRRECNSGAIHSTWVLTWRFVLINTHLSHAPMLLAYPCVALHSSRSLSPELPTLSTRRFTDRGFRPGSRARVRVLIDPQPETPERVTGCVGPAVALKVSEVTLEPCLHGAAHYLANRRCSELHEPDSLTTGESQIPDPNCLHLGHTAATSRKQRMLERATHPSGQRKIAFAIRTPNGNLLRMMYIVAH
jgi:hypothetical protein